MNLFRASLLLSATLSFCMGRSQWEPFNCGHNGNVSVTTGPGAIYKVSFGDGVYKSTNNGDTWDLSNTGLPNTGGAVFAQSIHYDGTQLFCGTESGIYKSTDNATNWVPASNGAPVCSGSNYPNKIYHVPGSTTTLAIFTANPPTGGVWRTTDGGANWFSGNGGLSTNMTIYNVALIGNTLYAATSTSIMISSNLGVSWTQLSPASNFATYAIAGVPGNLAVVSAFGFRRSLNNGVSWPIATGGPANPTKGEIILYDGKYWAVSGSATTSVYRSINNGQNWSEYETGLVSPNNSNQEEFHASGTSLYLACITDVYRHDGTTVGLEEEVRDDLPKPYPTVFVDGFTIDLSAQPAGGTLVLIDAMGREVQRRTDLPAAPVRIARDGLLAGTYRVMLVDPIKGTTAPLGAVIAE